MNTKKVKNNKQISQKTDAKLTEEIIRGRHFKDTKWPESVLDVIKEMEEKIGGSSWKEEAYIFCSDGGVQVKFINNGPSSIRYEVYRHGNLKAEGIYEIDNVKREVL